ncbi:hypothetical protein [Azospirillum sp.]|uniref:hypothetical protein n=1 Tax=Azospirillum sp. TaxID=34012 RepID=UPI003D73344C
MSGMETALSARGVQPCTQSDRSAHDTVERLKAAMDQRPALARKQFTRMRADLVAARERLLLRDRRAAAQRSGWRGRWGGRSSPTTSA